MKSTFSTRLVDASSDTTPGEPVSRLVTRPAVGIESTASLAEAAHLMRMQDVSSLLVDGGAAIVTERDISRAIGAGGEPNEAIGTVATRHPLVVDGSLSVLECGGLMLEEQVRHVLVAMPEGYTGVVSQRDIVGVLLRDADPSLWSSTRIPPENWLG